MIYNNIINCKKQRKVAVLIDPDKQGNGSVQQLLNLCHQCGVNLILAGGSLVSESTGTLIESIKKYSQIPVVLFPGSLLQLSNNADGILLLSLISGRNADYLISNHVIAAPVLKKSSLEIIPTGYILIESGKTTSVQYMSNTLPLPADKPDIAAATAMAGEMLGLKAIYLEAGSGAPNHVPIPIIEAVNASVKIPIIVGGGIRTKNELNNIFNAGADMVVIGTAAETDYSSLSKILL